MLLTLRIDAGEILEEETKEELEEAKPGINNQGRETLVLRNQG